jgi:O-antigen/teichoic acid export membrane protein
VIRLLDPSDYGLFAMTQVILVLLNLLNGYGLAGGLIQKAQVDDRAIRQLFGMLLLLNFGLGALQFLAAPLAAAYYRQPIVADLLRVQALLYIATPFIAFPYALLARAMDFRKQAQAHSPRWPAHLPGLASGRWCWRRWFCLGRARSA